MDGLIAIDNRQKSVEHSKKKKSTTQYHLTLKQVCHPDVQFPLLQSNVTSALFPSRAAEGHRKPEC